MATIPILLTTRFSGGPGPASGLDAGGETDVVSTRVAARSTSGRLLTMSWTLGAMVALYLFGIGFAAGLAAERVRVDQHRVAVLAHYDEALRQWHDYRMRLEKAGVDVPAGNRLDRAAQAGHAVSPPARAKEN
jgi:hypothetical protein